MDPSVVSNEPSISKDTHLAAPYYSRPPSPPFIYVPVAQRKNAAETPFELRPDYNSVNACQLSSQDFLIITRNKTQVAIDRAATWAYDQRRNAQQMLDFLYLGPTSVVRDHDFLQREGITMIIVARDARLATRGMLSVDKACAALGIESHYINIESSHLITSTLPAMTRIINNHMLQVFDSQVSSRNDAQRLVGEPDAFRHGKVLITCETGNDRSAAVAVAYIMALFSKDMVGILQFVNVQRFCCSFDESLKRTLQTWDDLLKAQSAVALNLESNTLGNGFRGRTESKRGLDDMMDYEQEATGEADSFATDRDRFTGREVFVPFLSK